MNAFRTILRFARRHAPEILSALSAAGTIGTGVLSARMMTKKNEDGKIPIAEIVPPAACAAATIGCIVGSNAISRKRQAGLAAAYMLLGRGMAELKGQTGVEVIEVDQKRPVSVSDGKKLFYESNSFQFFESTDHEVLKAFYAANALYTERGYLTLNELRKLLSPELAETEGGDFVGWELDDDEIYWVDYAAYEQEYEDETGEKSVCTVIETPWPARPLYDYKL